MRQDETLGKGLSFSHTDDTQERRTTNRKYKWISIATLKRKDDFAKKSGNTSRHTENSVRAMKAASENFKHDEGYAKLFRYKASANYGLFEFKEKSSIRVQQPQ